MSIPTKSQTDSVLRTCMTIATLLMTGFMLINSVTMAFSDLSLLVKIIMWLNTTIFVGFSAWIIRWYIVNKRI